MKKDGGRIVKEPDQKILYKTIARIVPRIEGRELGTGFFLKISKEFLMKIPNEKDNLDFHFFISNQHVITEEMIEKKETIDIFFGDAEKKREINLDKNERYIKYDKNHDYTIIQILKKDRIRNDQYLEPDPNYKKGAEFYKDKYCYLPGYPQSDNIKEENVQVRAISTGEIKKINKDYDFEHTLDTLNCSSGSPICLKSNLRLIGIHTGFSKIKKNNCGTFVGIIMENINKENIIKEINLIKEKDDSKEYDKENIEDLNQLSSSNEDLNQPMLNNNPISEEERNFDWTITYWILFISSINLKFFLISQENYSGLIGDLILYLINRFIRLFVIFFTNRYFLLFLISIQITTFFFLIFLKINITKKSQI